MSLGKKKKCPVRRASARWCSREELFHRLRDGDAVQPNGEGSVVWALSQADGVFCSSRSVRCPGLFPRLAWDVSPGRRRSSWRRDTGQEQLQQRRGTAGSRSRHCTLHLIRRGSTVLSPDAYGRALGEGKYMTEDARYLDLRHRSSVTPPLCLQPPREMDKPWSRWTVN